MSLIFPSLKSTVPVKRITAGLSVTLSEETLPDDAHSLILEGSYCNLPALRAYADLRLFVVTPEEIRNERLQKRESPESLLRFREKWIPLENAYFQAYGLPDEGCVPVPSPDLL